MGENLPAIVSAELTTHLFPWTGSRTDKGQPHVTSPGPSAEQHGQGQISNCALNCRGRRSVSWQSWCLSSTGCATIRLCEFNNITEPSVPIYRPNIQLQQCLVVPRHGAMSQAAQCRWLSGPAAGDSTAGRTPVQPLVSSEVLIRLCFCGDVEKPVLDGAARAPAAHCGHILWIHPFFFLQHHTHRAALRWQCCVTVSSSTFSGNRGNCQMSWEADSWHIHLP